MIHSFDTEVAAIVGIQAAVIMQHIMFWLNYNEANEINKHDGEYWTFASRKALQLLFPYLSEDQIKRSIKKLIDADLIKKGNYNKDQRDQTSWYTLTKNGQCIRQKSRMHWAKSPNALDENAQPLPDISIEDISIKDINPPLSTIKAPPKKKRARTFTKPTIQEIEAYARSIDYNLDAQQFYTYYDDREWMRDGKPMQSWKSAVHTWKHNDERRGIDTHAKPARNSEDLFAGLSDEQIKLYEQLANDGEHWG